MQNTEYHKPDSIEDALILLKRKTPRTAILAGGTGLTSSGLHEIQSVVDISGLGLDQVQKQASPPLIRVGAAVTLQTLVDSLASEPCLSVISVAAHATASLNVRNSATIAGTIVTADKSQPLVTALLACDADLVVQANEERTISLVAFLAYRERILAEGVLITEIRVPIPSSDTKAVYERVGRTPRDYPIVCAVAKCAVKDGIAGNIRVAVGGITTLPTRMNSLEFALEKKQLASHLDSALNSAVQAYHPDGDFLGSGEYRKEMARVLIRRAILKAAAPKPTA